MIAALYNIPNNPQTLARFSFHNRDQHLLAVDAIFRKTGIMLPQYPIDPILAADFKNWAYLHQAMHNSINTALNLQGNDLTDVDFDKPDEVATWIQLHASEHVAWGNALGLG